MIEVAIAAAIIKILESAAKKGKEYLDKKQLEKGIKEAIKELLKEIPDINLARAKIDAAKVAGIVSQHLFTAERMLHKVNAKAASVAKSTKGLVGFRAVKPSSGKTVQAARKKVKASLMAGKSVAKKSGKK